MCSWADDSTYCYPGVCGTGTNDLATECVCAENFGGPNCTNSKFKLNWFSFSNVSLKYVKQLLQNLYIMLIKKNPDQFCIWVVSLSPISVYPITEGY